MNKVILCGRITSDITRFGNGDNEGAAFTLVTSEPKIRDGKTVRNAQGYTETYDEFHDVVAYGGKARAIAEHKSKGEKLLVTGSIRKSTNEKEGVKYYNFRIILSDMEFI
jgi:single-strand DNA-binding protein